MWYHATAHYGGRKRHWWNRSRDDLIADVLAPLAGHQVRTSTRGGKPVLFNFGAVSYLTIIKTAKKLDRGARGSVPKELRDPEFVANNNATKEFAEEVRLLSASSASRSL